MEDMSSGDTFATVKRLIEDSLQTVFEFSKNHPYVVTGVGAVIFLYWYMKNNHGYFKKRGIPGPKPGFLGSFGDYAKGIDKFDKEVMAKYGRLVGIFHARQPIYMVGEADMIRHIMVKEFPTFVNRITDNFPKDKVFGDSLIATFDDHWKFLRSTLSPTFTSGKMRDMGPLIHKCTESLVRNLWILSGEGKESFKMKEVFGMYTLDVIASIAFGVELDCQSDPENPFISNARRVMNPGKKAMILMTLVIMFPPLGKLITKLGLTTTDPSARDFFVRTITEVLRQRREDNVVRKDFLQLMINSHKMEMDKGEEEPDTHLEFDKTKKRGMTNSEVIANACLFLMAGYETTSSALTFMSYLLATHPECQERLIREIDDKLGGKAVDYDNVLQLQYLENCFLETLRMFPATARTSRVANRDIEINGLFLEKDSEVHFPICGIHHDPEYWPEPNTFNPDRFLPENRHKDHNYVYIPFGAGPRNCIGMRLAHMEVKMAMADLLQKYKFKPAPETKIPPELDNQMKPKDGMMLMIEKR